METIKIGPLQEQWLQSLEQHPERQMYYWLGRQQEGGDYKACCLGEAGLVSGVCEWKNGKLCVKKEYVKNSPEGDRDYERTLNYDSHKVIGFRDEGGSNRDGTKQLFNMNDENIPWPEIAAIIRKDPSDWFTHSA